MWYMGFHYLAYILNAMPSINDPSSLFLSLSCIYGTVITLWTQPQPKREAPLSSTLLLLLLLTDYPSLFNQWMNEIPLLSTFSSFCLFELDKCMKYWTIKGMKKWSFFFFLRVRAGWGGACSNAAAWLFPPFFLSPLYSPFLEFGTHAFLHSLPISTKTKQNKINIYQEAGS